MGKVIVTRIGEGRMEEACQWESKVFQQVCVAGQQEATRYLEAVDESLFMQYPASWVVVGFRERTLVTRFGEMRIQRRLYQDRLGEYHFLLDEYLGLNANQAVTPEMQAMCTILCGEVSFRKAADFLEQWMTGLLSHSTCWRLLQRTGALQCEPTHLTLIRPCLIENMLDFVLIYAIIILRNRQRRTRVKVYYLPTPNFSVIKIRIIFARHMRRFGESEPR